MKRISIPVIFALLFSSILSFGQTLKEQIEDYTRKLESLHEKLSECGDEKCLEELMKQIEKLSKEAEKLVSRYDEEIVPELEYSGIVPPHTNLDHDVEKAKEKLRGKEKDPCYESMFVEEMIRQVRDVEPHWLEYIPVVAEVNFDFNAYYQHWWKDKDMISYNSVESLPGCLEIFRQEDNPERIISLKLYTTEGETGKTILIRDLQASLLSGKYPHKINKLKTIKTGDPQDFKIDPSGAYLFMEYNFDPLTQTEIPIRTLSLSGAWKEPDEGRLLDEPYTFVGDFIDFQIDGVLEVDKVGSNAFTLPEILDGIKTGYLSREFSLDYEYETLIPQDQIKERFVRNGTVKLELFFDSEQGSLVVTPNERFYSAGPDRDGAFSPDSKTYTLMNKGQTPIEYRIECNAEWLHISEKQGVIKPNGKKFIVCKVNETGRELKTANYEDKILFKNTSNGMGNTSRNAVLEVKEEQVWQIKLTGQVTDDLGGKKITIIGEPSKTVNFGIRFDFTVLFEITVEKKKDTWSYKNGIIKSSDVGISSNFDPYFFIYKNPTCKNCTEFSSSAGSNIGGEYDGQNIRLFWNLKPVIVEADWTIKGTTYDQGKKVDKGWTKTFFESRLFFERANDHYFPLKEGEIPFQIILTHANDAYRLESRKPITIYYRYFRKRIK